MPAPNGLWFTSKSVVRSHLGGTAAAAQPSWFYSGPSVCFGHMPPKKGNRKKG
jgi:hypothetical protein